MCFFCVFFIISEYLVVDLIPCIVVMHLILVLMSKMCFGKVEFMKHYVVKSLYYFLFVSTGT